MPKRILCSNHTGCDSSPSVRIFLRTVFSKKNHLCRIISYSGKITFDAIFFLSSCTILNPSTILTRKKPPSYLSERSYRSSAWSCNWNHQRLYQPTESPKKTKRRSVDSLRLGLLEAVVGARKIILHWFLGSLIISY